MISNKIRHILCAVLGKPSSRTTVTKAIDLASKYSARLTFAHMIPIRDTLTIYPKIEAPQ